MFARHFGEIAWRFRRTFGLRVHGSPPRIRLSESAAPKDEAQLLVDRAKVAETTREEMEALAAKVRDLVLRQPPIQLLGYLLAQFHLVMMLTPGGSEDEPRPNKDAIRAFQFALEYVHAVWSSYSILRRNTLRSMKTRLANS